MKLKRIRQARARTIWVRKLLAGVLFTASLGALVLAFAMAGPAMADDDPINVCCLCICAPDAISSGQNGNGVCVDGPLAECTSLCAERSCSFASHDVASCDNVIGCAQAATETMAPTASPLVLTAIALALAVLGLYTLTDPSAA